MINKHLKFNDQDKTELGRIFIVWKYFGLDDSQ